MADKAKGVEIDPVREKLIELMFVGQVLADAECDKQAECNKCPYSAPNACRVGFIADHLIANGVTVPRWIPVTERLPEIPDGWAENPEPVLYMMKNTKTIYAGYYGEGGVWRDKYFRQYADSRNGVDADDVLCWMWQHDLPEPPKGE